MLPIFCNVTFDIFRLVLFYPQENIYISIYYVTVTADLAPLEIEEIFMSPIMDRLILIIIMKNTTPIKLEVEIDIFV